MIRFLVVALVIAALITACDVAEAKTEGAKPMIGDRFQAVHAGTFRAAGADRANNRCIYIITDIQTHRHYLAVEGCGTSQLVEVDDGDPGHGTHLEEQ